MDEKTREYAGVGLGIVLIVGGIFSTGILPSTTLYQVLAGGIIVAGFAIAFASVNAFEFPE